MSISPTLIFIGIDILYRTYQKYQEKYVYPNLAKKACLRYLIARDKAKQGNAAQNVNYKFED